MNDARRRLVELLRSSDQLIDAVAPNAPVAESERRLALAEAQMREAEELIAKLFCDELGQPATQDDVRH